MLKNPLSPQLAMVREAVKQFPGSTVKQLSKHTRIPTQTLHRRLIELVRSKHLVRNTASAYSIAAAEESPSMEWHFVNAMTFETPTHRIRHVGPCWLAERKAVLYTNASGPPAEPVQRLNGSFATQEDAMAACEKDAYAQKSGR